MTVIDCREYLGYYFCCVYFAEILFFRYLVEQLATIAEPDKKRHEIKTSY